MRSRPTSRHWRTPQACEWTTGSSREGESQSQTAALPERFGLDDGLVVLGHPSLVLTRPDLYSYLYLLWNYRSQESYGSVLPHYAAHEIIYAVEDPVGEGSELLNRMVVRALDKGPHMTICLPIPSGNLKTHQDLVSGSMNHPSPNEQTPANDPQDILVRQLGYGLGTPKRILN